ncbi:MAG: 2,3,4,5-tetrahydropyridine-2,6-dicarboxylate N-succinyltransferase [Gammaproteobacteria bacterium]|nr:2,3,4,5-tetrahydropyridine-2,6-dicarboxylate N-succinyltransferase [Gammaproteobacteria bacterium]
MHDHAALASTIDEAWARRDGLRPGAVGAKQREAVHAAVELLDSGTARVVEKTDGEWKVHEWLKKAVLLYFRIEPNRMLEAGVLRFYDKVPLKFAHAAEEELRAGGVRVVPHAVVRKGAYIEPDVVLMPCYINIGARVGRGSMVDTWATVGSCAQVGRNVHISGGAGIGGVLEPLQARPTIIEDDCFIGARSEIVEGVIVETGAVISMGVFIGQSTRIYDRENDEVLYGRVPSGAVVVPGSLPSKDGKYHLACAVIVKRADAKTREKVGLNELLRI